MVETSITFKTNLKEVKAEQEGIIDRQKALYDSMVYYEGATKSALGDVLRQRIAWEQVEKTQGLSRNQIGAIGNEMDDLSKQSQQIRAPFEMMMTAILPGFNRAITPIFNRFEGIATAMRKVEEHGGFINTFNDYMKLFSTNLASVSSGITKVFGGGLQGLIAQMGVGLKALIVGFSGLWVAIAPLLPYILLVVGALFILQRMWVNNVGGMQTTWLKFTGQLRTEWSRFIVEFDRTMRELGPVIEPLVHFIGDVLILALQGLTTALHEINYYMSEMARYIADVKTNSEELIAPLKTVLDYLNILPESKVVKEKIASEREISAIEMTPFTGTQTTNNQRSANIVNNVAIYPSGTIDKESGTYLTDLISRALITSARVLI